MMTTARRLANANKIQAGGQTAFNPALLSTPLSTALAWLPRVSPALGTVCSPH